MPADSSFRFLAINDLHHAEPACTPFFERLVVQLDKHRPFDFCLLLGDLSDQGLPDSLSAVREVFARLAVPVHAVPGNHDCDVEQNTQLYAKFFPGQLNHHFVHRGWQFIGLDTTDGNGWQNTRVAATTLAYLDSVLPELSRTAPTVLFTHFPLSAVTRRLAPVNSEDLLSRLDGYNVRVVLGGHYHANTVSLREDLPLVTTACCSRRRQNHDGTLPEGYLVCTAHADGTLEREFVEFLPAQDTLAHAPLFVQLGWV